MEVPEVRSCFGVFPPKYATYLISIFGLSLGGVGLGGIILFGIIEKALLQHITGSRQSQIDANVRKTVLLTIGLASSLLIVGNALLLVGTTTSSKVAIEAGSWVIFAMCMVVIALMILAPVSCFIVSAACIVKNISTTAIVLSGIAMGIFLELWLYFMVVARNFMNEI